jgi:hypothetical protein
MLLNPAPGVAGGVTSITSGGAGLNVSSPSGAVTITNTGVLTVNSTAPTGGNVTVTPVSISALSLVTSSPQTVTGAVNFSSTTTFGGNTTFGGSTNTFAGNNSFNGNNNYSGTNTYTQPLTVNIAGGGISATGYTVNSGSYTAFLSSNSLQLYANGTGFYCPGSSIDVQFSGSPIAFFQQNGNFSITGDSSAGNVYAGAQGYKPGGGSWAASSDARLKNNVSTLTGALEKITSLAPVTYEWSYDNNEPTVGFIAQDLQKVMPNAISITKPNEEQKSFIDDDKMLAVGFQNDMFAYLVGAIKELNELVQTQAAEIVALKQKVGI